MNIKEFIQSNTLILDGGMGTLLQKQGLLPGEHPETWNLSHPDRITAIHRAYYEAGAHVVNANTFGANILKFSEEELDAIVSAAIANARRAGETLPADRPRWVALDIGPTGRMLKPYGDLDFEEAVRIFAATVRLGVKHGADLIFIETMNDSYETKAALLAAKEHSSLPVFVSSAYGEDGKLMTGADPLAMVALLEGMGADAIGVNCSLGPAALRGVVEEYLRYSSLPVILKPNAGLPHVVDGETVFDVGEEEFAREVSSLIALGVRAAGGCCGTTPDYIRALAKASESIPPLPLSQKNLSVVSSYTHGVLFGGSPILIGERINPTGKKRLKAALVAEDMDYLLREGLAEEERGVHVLDVNVGLPEIDEPRLLRRTVTELQAVTALPLQIDTADPIAMEAALRVYNGKAMINSVSGKAESMSAVFPLAKKYGGLVVALTLDETGIPSTAEGRVAIAERILSVAAEYGLGKKDLVFDPLALTVSADPQAANETLRAVAMLRAMGCHTSLGVSNVSFGLPARDAINGVFFTMALHSGLSAAIMNPHSAEMMRAYYGYRALTGLDPQCAEYVGVVPTLVSDTAPTPTPTVAVSETSVGGSPLFEAIRQGRREKAAELTAALLSERPPLALVEEEIIPALNAVGEGFEKKTVYLPGLLMSAEAASAAFEAVRAAMPSEGAKDRGRIVLATVKGDIHDIGKNIVRLLLENYGFAVTDLGRDVAPEEIVEAALRTKAHLVGLSALMTTTVPAMEETIGLLRERAPHCRVMVGGAVLTEEYARRMGADGYAKDAMEGVRLAESFCLGGQ